MFAVTPFKRGEFIANYTGRLLPNKVADELWTKYLFEVNNRWTIDGSVKSNIARYINHSCKPNADSDVKGHKIIILAKKSIAAGEEITYNYGRNYFDAFIKPHGCRCMACHQKASVKRSSPPRKRTKATKTKRKSKRSSA